MRSQFPPSGRLSFAATIATVLRIEVACQQGHAKECVHQLARPGRLGDTAAVGVDRAHVDQRPLGTEPAGEAALGDLVAEDELARRLGGELPASRRCPAAWSSQRQ